MHSDPKEVRQKKILRLQCRPLLCLRLVGFSDSAALENEWVVVLTLDVQPID